MENIRVAQNSITLPARVLKDLQIQKGDNIVLVKNADGDYTIRKPTDVLFDEIKQEVFSMADELGLKTIEEVRQMAVDLLHSYEESERGEALNGAEALAKLRATYDN